MTEFVQNIAALGGVGIVMYFLMPFIRKSNEQAAIVADQAIKAAERAAEKSDLVATESVKSIAAISTAMVKLNDSITLHDNRAEARHKMTMKMYAELARDVAEGKDVTHKIYEHLAIKSGHKINN